MQTPPLFMLFTATILYIGLGIAYTQMLRVHWRAFYRATNQNPALIALAIATWSIIFVVFITWRAFEPLTASRRKDWDEI